MMRNRKKQSNTDRFRFTGPLVSLNPSWNHPLSELLIYATVTLLTVAGTLLCLMSGYKLPVDAALVLLTTAGFSLLLTALYRSPVGGCVLPAGLLLFGTVLYAARDELRMEFVLLWNQALKMLLPNYAAPLILQADSPEYPAGIPLMLIVIFLYCLLVGFFSARMPRLFPVFVLTFPLIELVFLVGLAPHVAALACALTGYGMVLAISLTAGSVRFSRTGFHRKGQNTDGRRTRIRPLPRVFAPAMAAVLALMLCAVFLAQTYLLNIDYQRPQVLDDLRQTALDMNWRSLLYSPDLFRGQLSSASGQRFDHKTDIKVTTPRSLDTLYLKGYTAARYENGRWSQLDDSAYDRAPFTDMARNGTNFGQVSFNIADLYRSYSASSFYDNKSIAVEPVRTGRRYAYLPYLSQPSGDLNYDYDRFARLNGSSRYSTEYFEMSGAQDQFIFDGKTVYADMTFYLSSTVIDPSGTLSFEASTEDSSFQPEANPYEADYRSFARENYTAVPAGFERLQDAVQRYFLDPAFGQDQEWDGLFLALPTLISTVQEYLHAHADYSLSPGPSPIGQDPILYFLFENHKGYCMHFASAATLMFRCLGIPARYVEGYVVTDADFKTGKKLQADLPDDESNYELELPDSNAHAWTEIYLEGYGWYPVEVTPGYRNGIGELPTVTQERKERESMVSSAVASSSNISSATSSAPSSSGANTSSSRASSSPAKSKGNAAPFPAIPALFIFLAILVCAVLLPRHVILSLFRRKIAVSDLNASVLATYLFMVRLLSAERFPKAEYACYHPEKLAEAYPFLSGEQWEACMETVLCARFSGRSVTKTEQRELFSAFRTLQTHLYRQKKWPARLWMKYIRALI